MIFCHVTFALLAKALTSDVRWTGATVLLKALISGRRQVS